MFLFKKPILFSIFLIIKVANCQSTTTNDDEINLNPSECGHRYNYEFNKIVGGKMSQEWDWGWQVFLNYTKSEAKSASFFCGGSLINSRWILTAAHCFDNTGVSPNSFKVILGSNDLWDYDYESVAIRDVEKVILHSSYMASPKKENDIALLKLKEPVQYSDKIVPACLADGSFDYSGQNAFATGFGAHGLDTKITPIKLVGKTINLVYKTPYSNSSKLYEVEIPVLTEEKCKNVNLDNKQINLDVEFCAGNLNENKNTCNGDSGGPLSFLNEDNSLWYVVGVTSWGKFEDCSTTTIYTKVSNFYNWILNRIGEENK